MIICGTNVKYRQAPLPFPGQKKRYIKQFQKILERLPYGSIVFDAFGGSSLLARIAKDTRPDFEVVTNDFECAYRNRLAVVDDTNRVLKELWDAGAYRCNGMYKRYNKETEERLKEIVKTGIDQYTCREQIYVKQSETVRAHCRTVLYDVTLYQNWYKDLIVLNEFLDHETYKRADVYVLDPPYRNKGFTKRTKIYVDECGAQEAACNYCMECIEDGRKIILFDEVGSDLIELFMQKNKGAFDAYIPESVKGCYAKDMMITNIVE